MTSPFHRRLSSLLPAMPSIVLGVALHVATTIVTAAPPTAECSPAVNWNPQRYYSDSLSEAYKTREKRTECLISELEQARQSDEIWRFAYAARQLGIMRASKAIEHLVKHIDYTHSEFEPERDTAGYADIIQFYPAARALADIGPEVNGYLLYRLQFLSPEKTAFRVCCWTMLYAQAWPYKRSAEVVTAGDDYVKRQVLERIEASQRHLKPNHTYDYKTFETAKDVVRGFMGGFSVGSIWDRPMFPISYEIPRGAVGEPYSHHIQVDPPGTLPPRPHEKWTIETKLIVDETGIEEYFGFVSRLPKGLSLDGNGHISGTPQEAGEFRFVVRAQSKEFPDSYHTSHEFLLIVRDPNSNEAP